MSDAFLRHLFPPQCRVLGHRLPAVFSLWAMAGLEAIGSPLRPGAASTESVSLGDLQIAVRIVSTRWPDQPEMKPRLSDWWQQCRHREDKPFLQTQATAFSTWIALHSTPPELWRDEGGKGRLLTAPLVLAKFSALTAFPCFSLASLWNDISPGFAAWLLCADRERRDGDVRFWTDDDEAAASAEPEPELEALPDSELYALAVQQLGRARADAWLAARKARRNGQN